MIWARMPASRGFLCFGRAASNRLSQIPVASFAAACSSHTPSERWQTLKPSANLKRCRQRRRRILQLVAFPERFGAPLAPSEAEAFSESSQSGSSKCALPKAPLRKRARRDAGCDHAPDESVSEGIDSEDCSRCNRASAGCAHRARQMNSQIPIWETPIRRRTALWGQACPG